MQLGIISGYDEQSFQHVKGFGLSFIELCLNYGQDIDKFTSAIPNTKEFIEKYGVKIGSIGRWGGDKIQPDGEPVQSEIDIAYRLIDACAELGCPVYVAGCKPVEGFSFEQNAAAAVKYFGLLCERGKARGVKICSYNCRWDNFVVDDKAWTAVLGALPELGIKFDPSHARYAGEDYLSLMKKWASRFYHVHLKGSVIIDGERFDDPPIGMDQTNWGAFMAVLYNAKYQGGLSLEPHSETWCGELLDKGINFSVNYFRPYVF